MPPTPPGRLSPAALGVPPRGPQAPPVPPPAAGTLAQVLIAWSSAPFSLAPAWTDVTPYVRFEANISMQRGRQDNISTIQAGRLTLTLDNSDGRFTAGRSTSPYAPGVKIGRRIMVRVPDEHGAFTTRFDGLITELPAQWEGPGGQVNLAVIQASDILAWLGRQPPLLSWTQQEMLADNPVALWSLADSSNVSSALDQAGQGAAPLQVISQGDGTGAATAGSGVPLTEIQTSNVQASLQATQVTTFTDAGPVTWTAPLGTLVSCLVECWGGGKAGGSGSGAAGGNGSEYAAEPALAVTPGNTYTGTVGVGGVPSGGSGGDTTFTGDSVTVTAHASGSGSTNTTHHSGGTGGAGGGLGSAGSGGGSSGGTYRAGNNGKAGGGTAGGNGGVAVTGGGAGGTGDANPGTGAAGAGTAPGGGGGGGNGTAGGIGGNGQITITYTYIPPPSSQQNSAVSSWLFTPSSTLAARVLSGTLPQPVTAAAGFALECWADLASVPASAVSTFTTPGSITWTAPPGGTAPDVACWAGGKAGTTASGAAGGNGGEYAEEPALAATPGVTYSGTVGAPGVPSGGSGGDTTFTGDLVAVVAHASGSGSTNTTHHNGGSGGAGGGGGSAGSGGGSSGGPFQAGNAGAAGAASAGGAGGAATAGGGAGGTGDANPGTGGAAAGAAPGGGGGGGNGTTGGEGGAGQVKITVAPSSSALLTLVQPRGQYAIAVWVTSAGHLQLASTSSYGTRAPAWTTADAGQVPAAAFHVAVSVAAATGVATLYVNGVPAGTLTLPAGASYTAVTIGGAYGAWLAGWNGSAGLLAVYPAPLASSRIAVHYTAGTTGFTGSSTGTMIARIASYTGLPSFWYTPPSGTSDPSYGLTLTSYCNLAGQQPLAAMQAYELAEGGVLSVNAAGQLTFADRASRYAAGAAASAFTLAAGQYGTDTSYKSNDQYLTTEACYATVNLPGGYPVTSAAAEADYGSYVQNAGSPASPQTAPFADAAAAAGTYSTDDVMDAGNWAAGTGGQPVPRIPAATLDLRTLPGDGFSTAAFYAQDIGSAVQFAGLPSQAPDAAASPLAAYQLIEGINETLSIDAHDVQLYTSPLALNAAWIPGDALLGVLGSTNTVGRSQAPAMLGPPYIPVPTFSATLNRTGFAGAEDWRALTVNTQNKLTPPLLVAQQAAAQTLTTAAGQAVAFDTLAADTAAGMGTTTTYTIPAGFTGWWWASAVVQAATGTANLGGLDIWFSVTLAGVNSHWHARNLPYLSTAPYCAAGISGKIGPFSAGDTIQVVTAWSGTATSVPLGTADGGSMLTLIWEGYT